MAEVDLFQEVGGQLFDTIFSSIIWLFAGIVIFLILMAIMYYFVYYRRKFDIRVMIISERAGNNPSILEDKGAILKHRKTKTKYLRVLGQRVDLPVPPFNIVQRTNKGDMIQLWRKSEDEFIYLTPPEIDKTVIVRQDGRQYPISQVKIKQVEGDIAYWNIKRKEANKNIFDPESIFMKLLPYIPQILAGAFMVFILYIFMDSLPEILSQLTALTQELRSLKGADITTGWIWSLLK